MRQLRHRQQGYEPHLPSGPIPTGAEKPRTLMPDAAAPKEFLYIGKSPDCGEKDDPMLRERPIDSARLLAPLLHIEPDQCKVRHAVDDHISDGECVVGVECYYAYVPAHGSRPDHNVLSGVEKLANSFACELKSRASSISFR